MNRPSLLHIVERLEGFLERLPETIRKPILRELTPLKELFLQQRPPRFFLTGSSKIPVSRVLEVLFAATLSEKVSGVPMANSHWQDLNLDDHGTISILDGRGAEPSKNTDVQVELKHQPADIIFFLTEDESGRGLRKTDMRNLASCLEWRDKTAVRAKIIGVAVATTKGSSARSEQVLEVNASDQFVRTLRFSSDRSLKESRELMSILARELPNEARIEMIRISGDREAQREVAQILVKSTAAVCTAIGAQPIPLADLPILTTLQLVMVSGIMYVSGRERSLRAATEFIGALGANVGAGMLFREGTRALLKFFPGWGNVICGMVAGAGTYAIGRAATVFFVEGLSLKDARQVYLTSRKRRARPAIEAPKRPGKTTKRRK